MPRDSGDDAYKEIMKMKENNKTILEMVRSLLRKKADQLREDAGHAGEHGDRGASRLDTQVRFYEHGQKGEIPPEWRDEFARAKAKLDPEWNEYLRLNKKFGAIK